MAAGAAKQHIFRENMLKIPIKLAKTQVEQAK
jgi:hypothetical protein